MEPCLALKPANAPANLLRPCCARTRRSRWLVSRAIVVQLAACAICAATPSVRGEPIPPKVAQTDVLMPPKVIHGVKAEYPPEAAASGREADVVVLATVSATGEVTAVEIAEHGGDPFDDVALGAARQWTFTPALRNGKPIESQVRIPFHFRHGHEPEPTSPPATPRPTPTPTQTVPPAPAPPTPAAPAVAPAPLPVAPEAQRSYESSVAGRTNVPSRGASDYHVDVGALVAGAAHERRRVPQAGAGNPAHQRRRRGPRRAGLPARLRRARRPGHRVLRRRRADQRERQPARQRLRRHALHHPRAGPVAARGRGSVRSAPGQLRRRRLRRLPPRPRRRAA